MAKKPPWALLLETDGFSASGQLMQLPSRSLSFVADPQTGQLVVDPEQIEIREDFERGIRARKERPSLRAFLKERWHLPTEEANEILKGFKCKGKNKELSLTEEEVGSAFDRIIKNTNEKMPSVPTSVVEWRNKTKDEPKTQQLYMSAAHPGWMKQIPFWQNLLTYKMAFEAAGANVIMKPAIFGYSSYHSGGPGDNEVFIRDQAFLWGNKAFTVPYPKNAHETLDFHGENIARVAYRTGNWLGKKAECVSDADPTRSPFSIPQKTDFDDKAGFQTYPVLSSDFKGGDMLYDMHTHTAFIGLKNKRAAQKVIGPIAKETGFAITPLARKNEGTFFHLDLAMSILPNGEVLLNENGLDNQSLKTVKTLMKGRRIISFADESPFICNLLSIGSTAFMTKGHKKVEEEMKACGYDVILPQDLGLPENGAIFFDGGLHCITNEVIRP